MTVNLRKLLVSVQKIISSIFLSSLLTHVLTSSLGHLTGGDTTLYKLYKCVQPIGVQFLSRSGF